MFLAVQFEQPKTWTRTKPNVIVKVNLLPQ